MGKTFPSFLFQDTIAYRISLVKGFLRVFFQNIGKTREIRARKGLRTGIPGKAERGKRILRLRAGAEALIGKGIGERFSALGETGADQAQDIVRIGEKRRRADGEMDQRAAHAGLRIEAVGRDGEGKRALGEEIRKRGSAQ